MKKIAITRTDGGISIMHLSEGMDIDQEIQKWESSNSSYRRVSYCIVEDFDLVKEKGLWTHSKSAFTLSIEYARKITKERLRGERKPLLDSLDLAYMRADELGDTEQKADIVTEKQRLRDLPDTVDLLDDIESLKALTAAKD